MKYLLLATLFTLCFSNAAKAEYLFHESIEYLSVKESNPKGLLTAISKRLKKRCKVSGHPLSCTTGPIYIKPSYTDLGKGQCGISEIEFVVNAAYHFPIWTPQEPSHPKIHDRWRVIFENIILHEKHHGKIRDKYMKQAYEKALKLKTHCKNIKRALTRILEEFSYKEKRDNRRFDKQDKNIPTRFPN